MAARRGKITEVTITDRLADSSAHEESGFGGIGPMSVAPGRANASAPGASSRGYPGWACAGRQPGTQPAHQRARSCHAEPGAQNPAQGGERNPPPIAATRDSYGQDGFVQDGFAQGGLFGVPAPSPSMNPGTGLLLARR